jgi:hypothetical protein
MNNKFENESEPKAPDSDKENETDRSIYIFDPETGEWKVKNPSGSIAYNVLSRDEWSWLD